MKEDTATPTNQFLKQERATQTMNRYSKANNINYCTDVEDYFNLQTTTMQTSPPMKRRFNGLVNQWVIYDKYMMYEAAKERAEENEVML